MRWLNIEDCSVLRRLCARLMPEHAMLKNLGNRIRSTAQDAAGKASQGLRAAAKSLTSARSVQPPSAVPPPPIPDPPPPPEDPTRRHVAARPQSMSRKGWLETAASVFDEIFLDRLFLVAAGVAFYVTLSIFPALSVLVWLFALVADPAQLVDSLADMAFVLPPDALAVLRQQAVAVSGYAASQRGPVVALTAFFAIWSANAGMKGLIDAMNLIYNVDEKRSFIALNIRSLFFTLAALAVFLISLAVLIVTPKLLALIDLQNWFARIFVVLRWPALFAATVIFLVLLNRYGPSRPPAQSRWALWGSVFGAAIWLLLSAGFSFYVEKLANLAAFYGSLAAIAGLMLWLWLSALVILIGIELNHELELRTLRWEERERWRAGVEAARRERLQYRAPPPPSLLRRTGRRLLDMLSRK